MQAHWMGPGFSPKAQAPMTAAATIPTPAHLAQATPTGNAFMAGAIVQEQSAWQAIDDAPRCRRSKPFDDLGRSVPAISSAIANPKTSQAFMLRRRRGPVRWSRSQRTTSRPAFSAARPGSLAVGASGRGAGRVGAPSIGWISAAWGGGPAGAAWLSRKQDKSEGAAARGGMADPRSARSRRACRQAPGAPSPRPYSWSSRTLGSSRLGLRGWGVRCVAARMDLGGAPRVRPALSTGMQS